MVQLGGTQAVMGSQRPVSHVVTYDGANRFYVNGDLVFPMP